MPRKKNNGEILCVYCQDRPGDTKDHVIPRLLLPKVIPYGTQLITVSSCFECNNRKSLDDAYLRDLLSHDVHTQDHPGAECLRDKFHSSCKKNRSEIARVISNAQIKDSIYISTRIYVGDFISPKVEVKRLQNIFSNIVIGLHFNSYRKHIPVQYTFNIHQALSPEVDQVIIEWEKITNRKISAVKKFYFGQAHLFLEDDPFQFLWLLVFFGGYTTIVESQLMANFDRRSGYGKPNE